MLDQFLDLVFVQVAAGYDLRLLKTLAIEDFAHAQAFLEQVAAVQPHAGNFAPQAGGHLRARQRVVGIDQQDRRFRKSFE